MKSNQLSFHSNAAFKDHKPRTEHGSDIRKGRRKLARPFDSKKFLHMVLRSKRARGIWSFLRNKNEKKIQKLIFEKADRAGVKVIRFANAGNHLHLLLKAPSKRALQRYLRTITGLIPRAVTGARKGQACGSFWDGLAYSKIVNWGRQFKATTNYVFKNSLEAFGIIPPRDNAKAHVNLNYEEIWEG